jgi:hypothetical protein
VNSVSKNIPAVHVAPVVVPGGVPGDSSAVTSTYISGPVTWGVSVERPAINSGVSFLSPTQPASA